MIGIELRTELFVTTTCETTIFEKPPAILAIQVDRHPDVRSHSLYEPVLLDTTPVLEIMHTTVDPVIDRPGKQHGPSVKPPPRQDDAARPWLWRWLSHRWSSPQGAGCPAACACW